MNLSIAGEFPANPKKTDKPCRRFIMGLEGKVYFYLLVIDVSFSINERQYNHYLGLFLVW